MILVVAALSCVVGLGVVVLALARLVRSKTVSGIGWFSPRGLGAFGILLAQYGFSVKVSAAPLPAQATRLA